MASNRDRPRSHKAPDRWQRQVTHREARKERARATRDRSIWFGLGMMGLVGWAVSIPTVLGIALGVWIDKRWPSEFSWTLMMLSVGVILGCFNAWQWVKRESRDEEMEAKEMRRKQGE